MILSCPVCRRERHAPATDWISGSAYHCCSTCGVEFAEPVPPAEVFPDFSAYGDHLLARAHEPYVIDDHEQPSEFHARRWAHTRLPQGSHVLEFFAECGRFAWIMRREGYVVRTVDPLEAHTSVLRKHGFESVTGQLDAVPVDWPAPAAIFILESIVRVRAPRALIEGIRTRWPGALLYLTAPSLRRSLKLPTVTGRGYLPPDFITRWEPSSLRHLLEQSGYCASSGTISPMLVRRIPPTRWKRRLFNLALTFPLRLNGEYAFSEWAAGAPSSNR